MKSSHDSASVGMPNLSELSIFGTQGCCDDMTGFCVVVSVVASMFAIGTSENTSKSSSENDWDSVVRRVSQNCMKKIAHSIIAQKKMETI